VPALKVATVEYYIGSRRVKAPGRRLVVRFKNTLAHANRGIATMLSMLRSCVLLISVLIVASAADLPTKKWLNLAAIKTMVAAAEAEAQKRNVQVTICIVDENGNLLFLQKADGAGVTTIQFAQKKARYAALYRRPSRAAAEQLKAGNLQVLAFPDAFPNQGGLPVQIDGQTIGGVAASGAASEVDEAIAQSAIDGLLKK